jgi:hypothetical protein
MKPLKYLCIAALVAAVSCEGYLDRTSENIISDEDVFSDENMVKAVLANYYGRIDWGQSIDNSDSYMETDECANSGSGGWRWGSNPDGYNNDIFRVQDYRLIRDINEFLVGVRSEAANNLSATFRSQLEGEVRFIRAWTYFNMGRCMGGMPIVGDEVFAYEGGMDITALQVARSTEAGLYDYVIDECTAIAPMLPEAPQTNAARANKWAALVLKARAAVYAASIARYNNSVTPDIKTADYDDSNGGAVGIPASKANAYYQTALATAKEIEAGGRYDLYQQNPDPGVNFYEAVCKKSGNNEVIWARDHYVPSETGRTSFTNGNGPLSQANDADANRETVILNLVEAFEYKTDRDGTLKTRTTDGSDYIFYDKPEDLFADKDARLYGSVIYSGADWNGKTIIYQSGQKKWNTDSSRWETVGASPDVDTKDADGDMLVSIDGPNQSEASTHNNTGFNFRKFMDYTPAAFTRGIGSDMWFVRMRYAEVLLIAAEAAMELGNGAEALSYINRVRARAGIQALTTVTLRDIERERRVEFAFENHRWWDLKRWRLAHVLWNNGANIDLTNNVTTHTKSAASDNNTSGKFALFPYKVKGADVPAHEGKYVYEKVDCSPWTYNGGKLPFQMRNYYNFLDNDWLNRNPKLVRNPYQ